MFKFLLCLLFFSSVAFSVQDIFPYKYHIEPPIEKKKFFHEVGVQYLELKTDTIAHIKLFAMFGGLKLNSCAKVNKWSKDLAQFKEKYLEDSEGEGIFFDTYIQLTKQNLPIAITLVNCKNDGVENEPARSLKELILSVKDFVFWAIYHKGLDFRESSDARIRICHKEICQALGSEGLIEKCSFCIESEKMKKSKEIINKANMKIITKNMTITID